MAKYKKIQELLELEIEAEEPDGIEWRCDKCRVVKDKLGQLTKRIQMLEAEIKTKLEELKKDLDNKTVGIKEAVLSEWHKEGKASVEKIKQEINQRIRKRKEKKMKDRKKRKITI